MSGRHFLTGGHFLTGNTGMKSRIASLIALAWLATADPLSSQAPAEWFQWRGANRDGVSQETGLLKQWPSEGPKLLWQAKAIDEGYSTPAIVGDRLLIRTQTHLYSIRHRR